eukprot:scaffold117166_cov66-Phaeocystis_antarctica.AAC.4
MSGCASCTPMMSALQSLTSFCSAGIRAGQGPPGLSLVVQTLMVATERRTGSGSRFVGSSATIVSRCGDARTDVVRPCVRRRANAKVAAAPTQRDAQTSKSSGERPAVT